MLVFVGENTYARDEALRKLAAHFDAEPIICNGDELSLDELPDLLMGQSLFATKRLVIIKRLSENKSLWQSFEQWHPRISDDVTVVLVEDKPDKRLAIWKYLQKNAEIREYPQWTEKQSADAREWMKLYAKQHGVKLSDAAVRTLLERVGYNQASLAQAVDKLALADEITEKTITELIDATPAESAFGLFEESLKGNIQYIQRVIASLKQTEDPYRVMGLLSTQLLQFAAVCAAVDSAKQDSLSIPPFVQSRMRKLKQYYSSDHIRMAAATDRLMKTTSSDPWELVEKLLLQIATK